MVDVVGRIYAYDGIQLIDKLMAMVLHRRLGDMLTHYRHQKCTLGNHLHPHEESLPESLAEFPSAIARTSVAAAPYEPQHDAHHYTSISSDAAFALPATFAT